MRSRLFRLSLAAALSGLIVGAAPRLDAQTPPPPPLIATLELITGEDGTDDLPVFTLIDSEGRPLGAAVFGQPGAFVPGAAQSYRFSVPTDFCTVSGFSIDKPTFAAGDDPWTIAQAQLTLDDAVVWTSLAPAVVTAAQPLRVSWSADAAYRERCGELAWTPVELRVVTGENGTADDLELELTGTFDGAPYRETLRRDGDLAPGQTDVYSFAVPMEFCEITGYRLRKPALGEADDDWEPREIYLTIAGAEVFFDRAASLFAPVTADSPLSPNGDWSGTAEYLNRCAGGIAPTATPTVPTEPPIATLALATPTAAAPSATAGPTLATTVLPLTLLAPGIVPGTAVLNATRPPASATPTGAATATTAPTTAAPTRTPAPVITGSGPTCPGFLPSRLAVGAPARVTPGLPNNVRAEPRSDSAKVGEIPGGAGFSVLSGPVCDPAGMAWWEIEYAGLRGWTAEGRGGEYWTEPG